MTAAPEPGRSERLYAITVVAFAVAIVGGIVAAVGYSTGETDEVLGLGLAAALGGIGFGLVTWAKYLDLDEHVVQTREPLVTTAADREAMREELELTASLFGRRRLLLGLAGGSFVSALIGFVGPIGSLGPKPRGERARTAWSAGARLVTAGGTPIQAEAQRFGELVTVFPEGHEGVDDSQVVLMRLRPDVLTERTRSGATENGWVAYSKICTHAGCSVGLLGIDDLPPDEVIGLVCPCHQSVFDPRDAAHPVGGPATRRLPQLALDVDGEGYLVARAPFEGPVGPLAWDEA